MQQDSFDPSAAGNPQSTVSEPFPLPCALSELLHTAIADARSLSPDTYVPCSSQWHFASTLGTCQVCLAGSLIAGSLNNSPRFNAEPDMFSDDTDDKLRAVDAMRQGEWTEAYDYLYGEEPSAETRVLLLTLPKPVDIDFFGWRSFKRHLASLEVLLPTLAEIDELAAG